MKSVIKMLIGFTVGNALLLTALYIAGKDDMKTPKDLLNKTRDLAEDVKDSVANTTDKVLHPNDKVGNKAKELVRGVKNEANTIKRDSADAVDDAKTYIHNKTK